MQTRAWSSPWCVKKHITYNVSRKIAAWRRCYYSTVHVCDNHEALTQPPNMDIIYIICLFAKPPASSMSKIKKHLVIDRAGENQDEKLTT